MTNPPDYPHYTPRPPAPAPAPGRRKSKVPLLLGLVCCLALFFVIVAIAALIPSGTKRAEPDGSGPAVAEHVEAPPGTPAPGLSAWNPIPVGTQTTPAKGWAVTVPGTARDATDDIVKANQFNRPSLPGVRLYAVPVTVRNETGRPGMAITDVKVGLLIPSGISVDPRPVAGFPTVDLSAKLQPAGQLTGVLVFEATPADYADAVILVEPRFTLDENDDQRFLAIR